MPTPGCQAAYVLHSTGSSTHTLTATQTESTFMMSIPLFLEHTGSAAPFSPSKKPHTEKNC